jgi:hypothetical protein
MDELTMWAMFWGLWLAFWFLLHRYRADLERLGEVETRLIRQEGEIRLARKQKARINMAEYQKIQLEKRVRELEYELKERFEVRNAN